ncbi:hypothetical protein [Variovorax soli]|uniref:hypothetical protein n=1 Tax=Variovorax soli TaxID=376815 RepID=UPI0012948733|nr:hypothetical protein [Variovorax soli]
MPDYVENVARQANFVRLALNSLGFRDPMESSRYRAVKYIDISVKDLGAYNGLAYDEHSVYPNVPIKTNDCALLIDIARHFANFPATTTPIVGHEVPHLLEQLHHV